MAKPIWLLGAMASGKTTLCRHLMHFLSDEISFYNVRELIDGEVCCYTRCNNVAVLGRQSDTKISGGVDDVFKHMKLTGLRKTMEVLNKDKSIEYVIIEGSQASWTWFNLLSSVFKQVYVFHIHMSYEENLRRLKYRQYVNLNKKEPCNFEHLLMEPTDNQIGNVLSKNSQYNNLFEKVSKQPESVSLQLNGSLSVDEWLVDIVQLLTN